MLNVTQNAVLFHQLVKQSNSISRKECIPSFRHVLDTQSDVVKDTREIFTLCKKGAITWLDVLFKRGYLTPPIIFKRFLEKEYMDDRKLNISKRYKLWKNLRWYLKDKFDIKDSIWYPKYQFQVFQFLNYDKKELIPAILLFFQFIISHIPLYDCYQFDPLPGKGYKYYSGEKFIFYYLTQEVKVNQRKFSRLRHAFIQKKANGYDLKNVFKVIICTFDWKPLDDQRGTGVWKHFIFDNNYGSIFEYQWQIMMFWTDFYDSPKMFLDKYILINKKDIKKDKEKEEVREEGEEGEEGEEREEKEEEDSLDLPWPWFLEKDSLKEIPLTSVGLS